MIFYADISVQELVFYLGDRHLLNLLKRLTCLKGSATIDESLSSQF